MYYSVCKLILENQTTSNNTECLFPYRQFLSARYCIHRNDNDSSCLLRVLLYCLWPREWDSHIRIVYHTVWRVKWRKCTQCWRVQGAAAMALCYRYSRRLLSYPVWGAKVKRSSMVLCFSYFLETMSLRNLNWAIFDTGSTVNFYKVKQDEHAITCSVNPVLPALLTDPIFSSPHISCLPLPTTSLPSWGGRVASPGFCDTWSCLKQ